MRSLTDLGSVDFTLKLLVMLVVSRIWYGSYDLGGHAGELGSQEQYLRRLCNRFCDETSICDTNAASLGRVAAELQAVVAAFVLPVHRIGCQKQYLRHLCRGGGYACAAESKFCNACVKDFCDKRSICDTCAAGSGGVAAFATPVQRI